MPKTKSRICRACGRVFQHWRGRLYCKMAPCPSHTKNPYWKNKPPPHPRPTRKRGRTPIVYKSRYPEPSPYEQNPEHHKLLKSAAIGTISELSVAVDLMKKGFAVFCPFVRSQGCDLIAMKGETVRRLEVRTGRVKKSGDVLFSASHNRFPTEFAVYNPISGVVYYIPISALPDKKGGLRSVFDAIDNAR